MNKSSIVILLFATGILLSCGICGNVIDDLKTKFSEESVKHQYKSESENYSSEVVFGERDGVNFKEMDKFTETGVLIVPINAKITLQNEFDAEKIRTTIYKVEDGLIFIQDRYTNNINMGGIVYFISLPIYSPGFYKVDFEYEDGEVFASGTVEVEEDEE